MESMKIGLERWEDLLFAKGCKEKRKRQGPALAGAWGDGELSGNWKTKGWKGNGRVGEPDSGEITGRGYPVAICAGFPDSVSGSKGLGSPAWSVTDRLSSFLMTCGMRSGWKVDAGSVNILQRRLLERNAQERRREWQQSHAQESGPGYWCGLQDGGKEHEREVKGKL